jgi:probable rRNA maturation factor
MDAARLKYTIPYEIVFLYVHGLLHIFGYDHETDAEYDAMMKLTISILKEHHLYENERQKVAV